MPTGFFLCSHVRSYVDKSCAKERTGIRKRIRKNFNDFMISVLGYKFEI